MGGTTTAERFVTRTVKILFILNLVGLAACATSTAPPPAATSNEPEFADEYRIGVGDRRKDHIITILSKGILKHA